MISLDEVKHIANLARLSFSEDELEKFTNQFNEIIAYMDKLNELDTSNVEPLSHPVETFNVFREDEIKNSISRKEALMNAPCRDEKFFQVPKVISKK
jgi:aspartyl-tRNA(Asn)/glutamyl-tRNA(Gln) amidotransferase subunit C